MPRQFEDQGFVILSQTPAYIARVVEDYLNHDAEIDHVVLVYARRFSSEETIRRLREAIGARKFHAVAFEDYGAAANLEQMQKVPADRLLFVILDLCRMVGNRLDMRLEHFYTMQRARRKVVIDPAPYIAKAWRVFFPYGVFNRSLLGYNHSYAIEGEYNKFRDGQRDTDPCAVETIAPLISPATFIDYEHFFSVPEIVTEPVTARVRADYEALKQKLFDEEKTIAPVLAGLDEFAQSWMPCRRLPKDLKKIYQPGFHHIVKTDLPIDDYLSGEIMTVIEHTNQLTARLYAEQSL